MWSLSGWVEALWDEALDPGRSGWPWTMGGRRPLLEEGSGRDDVGPTEGSRRAPNARASRDIPCGRR